MPTLGFFRSTAAILIERLSTLDDGAACNLTSTVVGGFLFGLMHLRFLPTLECFRGSLLALKSERAMSLDVANLVLFIRLFSSALQIETL